MTNLKSFYIRNISILLVCFVNGSSSFAQKNNPKIDYLKGSFVDIGGYRLHINPQGKGNQTVVFIAGSLAFSFDWYFVQKEVGQFSKTISYDRPGLAWSDAGPSPRTMRQDVYELHQLLSKSNLRPPFVLVGHSLGGIIARMYNKEYPNEVAGMVLVDPFSEEGSLFMNRKIQKVRLLATPGKKIPNIKTQVDSITKLPSQKDVDDLINFIGKPKSEFPFTLLPATIQKIRLEARNQPGYQIADAYDFWAEELEEIYRDSLNSIGNKPLVVLTGAKRDIPKEMDSMFSAKEIRQILVDKKHQKAKIAQLSTNNKFIVVAQSGHEIHIEKPEVVVSAIRAVLQSIHTKRKLKL